MPDPSDAAAPAEVPVPAVFPPAAEPAPPQPAGASGSGERFAHGVVSRTWDMELLISGAVVFALLQAPRALNAAFDRLAPLLDGQAWQLLFYAHFYGSIMVYVLAAAFVVHLAARAYWVGLIGLDSVFPRGIDWRRARSVGPVGRQYYHEHVPDAPALIRRLDDFCSVIFPAAFMLVIAFLFSLLLASLSLGALYLVQQATGWRGGARVVVVLAVGIALLSLVLSELDRRRGARLGGRARGWLLRALRFLNALVALPFYGGTMMTLMTNLRGRWFWSLLALPLVGGAAASLLRLSELRVDSAFYLPDEAGAHAVSYAYYRDQRPAGEVFRYSPWIQSDVIREPYLKLFLPYVPRRHNAAVAARCPDVRPLHRSSLRFPADAPAEAVARSVLACLARLQPITLNGRPLTPEFSFYEDPRTGARGLLAHIPTDALPRGRNLLRVARLPRYVDGRADGEPRPPFEIPFWR